MRRAPILLVLLLFAPIAGAQEPALELRFTATDDGFRVEGYADLNPTIRILPGSRVVATLTNAASAPESLRFAAPIGADTGCCTPPGNTATIEFSVASDARAQTTYSSASGGKLRGVVLIQEPTPAVDIVAPAPGTDHRGDVTMEISVRDFTLEPFSGAPQNDPARGHVEYSLDGKRVFGPTDRTTYTFSGLSTGRTCCARSSSTATARRLRRARMGRSSFTV